jgi:hypothetical protein
MGIISEMVPIGSVKYRGNIVKIDPNLVLYGKLIAGVMASDLELMQELEQKLSEKFGPCERSGAPFSFDDFTDYYAKEMGEQLQKKFISFSEMILLEELPDIKHVTNDLERQYAVHGDRRINIDPGYVTHAQMVLATTKQYSHRIYLGKGIHAELTYICKKKAFHPLEWTYPDYRERHSIEFFEQVRQDYLQQMRSKG